MANLISALNAKSHNLQSVKFAMTPHSVAMLIPRFPVKSPRALRTVSCLHLHNHHTSSLDLKHLKNSLLVYISTEYIASDLEFMFTVVFSSGYNNT